MVYLGKFVKGKAPSTTDQKRTFIKIRHQDKGIEDLDQE
jgi:hypothetical protein